MAPINKKSEVVCCTFITFGNGHLTNLWPVGKRREDKKKYRKDSEFRH
jgi:hypothetical protein